MINLRKKLPGAYHADSTLILQDINGQKSSISFFVSNNIPYVIVGGETYIVTQEVIRTHMTNSTLIKKANKLFN